MLKSEPAAETADMLIVDATITGGTPEDPQLEFDAIGIGSIVKTGEVPGV